MSPLSDAGPPGPDPPGAPLPSPPLPHVELPARGLAALGAATVAAVLTFGAASLLRPDLDIVGRSVLAAAAYVVVLLAVGGVFLAAGITARRNAIEATRRNLLAAEARLESDMRSAGYTEHTAHRERQPPPLLRRPPPARPGAAPGGRRVTTGNGAATGNDGGAGVVLPGGHRDRDRVPVAEPPDDAVPPDAATPHDAARPPDDQPPVGEPPDDEPPDEADLGDAPRAGAGVGTHHVLPPLWGTVPNASRATAPEPADPPDRRPPPPVTPGPAAADRAHPWGVTGPWSGPSGGGWGGSDAVGAGLHRPQHGIGPPSGPAPGASAPLALAELWSVTHRRLDHYHAIALDQARTAFRNAQAAMVVGFLLLIGGGAAAVLAPTTVGSVVSGALGAAAAALAAFISRTFVRSQEAAAAHLRSYFDQPVEFSRYLAAERLVAGSELTEEQRGALMAVLVRTMATGGGDGGDTGGPRTDGR